MLDRRAGGCTGTGDMAVRNQPGGGIRPVMRVSSSAHRGLQLELVSERHTREVILLAFIQQQCIGPQSRVAKESNSARSLRNLPVLSRNAARRGSGERDGGHGKSRREKQG